MKTALAASLGVHLTILGIATLAPRLTVPAQATWTTVTLSSASAPPARATPARGGNARGLARPTTTVAGGGADELARRGIPVADSDWTRRLRERVREDLRYPLALRRRGLEGRVEVALAVENGRVETAVARTSGSPELDRLAIAAVARAGNELPPDLNLHGEWTLPVEFLLKRP